MRMQWFRYGFVLCFTVFCIGFITSCKKDCPDRKDCNTEPTDSTTTTPYTIAKPNRFPDFTERIDPTNPLTVEGIELGRFLFYDPLISKDSSMSCATCHQQEHAFADPNQFSINAIGQPTKRNTQSLFNLLWSNHFFWDGRASTLVQATDEAIREELHPDWSVVLPKLKASQLYGAKFTKVFNSEEPTPQMVSKALSQFMLTLISSNTKTDEELFSKNNWTSAAPEIVRGYNLFIDAEGADCFHCHFSSPLMHNNTFENNGMDSAVSLSQFVDKGRGGFTGVSFDMGKFKTPSLRNLKYTAPYMHDGRFATLRELIDFYSEGLRYSPTVSPSMEHIGSGGVRLTESEKNDLIAFLMALTDSQFVNNPKFSDPFK